MKIVLTVCVNEDAYPEREVCATLIRPRPSTDDLDIAREAIRYFETTLGLSLNQTFLFQQRAHSLRRIVESIPLCAGGFPIGAVVAATPYSSDAQATIREIIGELEESMDPQAALRIANEYIERAGS